MSFSHIIHIADLHIRNGDTNKSRFYEYNTVFDRLIQDLSHFQPILDKTTIILIAGDIFHDKLKIESCGLQLINTFLHSLSLLAPVIIIRGNHDYRQEFPDEPDLIQSLLYNPIDNVHYWNQDGHYILGNIGFGLVSIQNALMSGNTSGITNELPTVPDPTYFNDTTNKVDHKFALFHGPIGKTKLQNGTTIMKHHSYPIEWFKGYDAALLGDIHLQQVNNCSKILKNDNNNDLFKHSSLVDEYKWTEKQPWAYPGSMIQQSYGEGVTSHGFLVWNLQEKKIACYHINNDFGYIYLQKNYENSTILIKHNMKWINILDVINKNWFPSKCHVRIVAQDNHDMIVIDEIRQVFTANDKHVINIMHYLVNNATPLDLEENENIDLEKQCSFNYVDISSFNTPSTWAEFIENASTTIHYEEWKSWFDDFNTLQVPQPDYSSLHPDVLKRNTKIQTEIIGLQNSLDMTSHLVQSKKKTFSINFIEFENILCFKGKNYFNFDQNANNDKALVSIVAPNGCGKTSFLETICIALYGEDLPSRTNSSYSAAIIYKHKNADDCAQTSIFLTVEDKKYKIKRVFLTQINDPKIIRCQSANINIHEYNESSKSYQHICSGSTMVNKWVEDNIGPFQAFLLSALISQNGDMDFFQLTSAKQRNLLDSALHLNSTTCFQGLVKESRLAHHAILDLSKTLIKSSFDKTNIDQSNVELDILSISHKISSLQKTKDSTLQTYHILNTRIQNIRNFSNLFKLGKSTLLDTIHEYDKKLKTIDDFIIKLQPLMVAQDIGKLQNKLVSIDRSLFNKYIDIDLLNQPENKITSLQQELIDLPRPQHSIEEITTIESDLSRLLHNFKQIYPTADIYDIHEIILTTNQQLSSNIESLDQCYYERTQIQDIISNNKQCSDDLLTNRPIDLRSTTDEHFIWKQAISNLEGLYESVNQLQLLYDQSNTMQIICPDQDFNYVLDKYTSTQTIQVGYDLVSIQLDIKNVTHMISEKQDIYHDSLKKQPPLPFRSLDEFHKWNNDLLLINTKYTKGFDWLELYLEEDLQKCKPPIPHTSISQLQETQNVLLKQVTKNKHNLLKINISQVKIDLENYLSNALEIKQQVTDLENNLLEKHSSYILHLSNKPQSPLKYNDIQEFQDSFHKYNNEKTSILELLKSNKKMTMDIESSKKNLIALEKFIPSLKNISSQQEEFKSMLDGIQEHAFNPECWACLKQPWKIQQDTIQSKIVLLDKSIKDHGKQIKAIVGLSIKPSIFLTNLKAHVINLDKYYILVKEKSFWNDEKNKIDETSKWKHTSSVLANEVQQLQTSILSQNKHLATLQENINIIQQDINNYSAFQTLQKQLDDCLAMIQSWTQFNTWQDSWNVAHDDLARWKSLLELNEFWTQDSLRRKKHDQWKDTIINMENDILINKAKSIDLQYNADILIIRQTWAQWNEYNSWKNKHDQYHQHLSLWNVLLDKREFWDQEIKRSQALNEWKVRWDQIQNDIHMASEKSNYIESNFCRLSKIKDALSQNIVELKEYELQFLSLKETLIVVNTDKNIYSNQDNLSLQIQVYQQYIETIQLQEEISSLQGYLDDINTHHDITKVYKHYTETFHIWDEWNTILIDYQNISPLDCEIQKLGIQKAIMIKHLEEYKENLYKQTSLQAYITTISERYEALCTIYESFGQFKKWIYENKVMPFLQNSANNIINKISIARPIYIQSHIYSDSTGALQFAWFIQDGKTVVPIQKASGFQKNMSCFAIRIALSQIGATSIKPSQLFIDEGFTSCDHDNRSRVGELLIDLLDTARYQQLIIVTHLEDINAFANTYVHIKRTDDDASLLQYGTPMAPVKIARKINAKKK